MSRTRVAIVCTHPLFGRGIARLLEADGSLDVVCVAAGSDDVSERLKGLKPHAIVVEEGDGVGCMTDVVRDVPPTMVIGLRPHDNVMDVCQSWQVAEAKPDDLLQAVRFSSKQRLRRTTSRGKVA